MKTRSAAIYVYPLAAMVFWGLSFVWTSILLKYYQPVTIIFIRLILSTLFLFPVVLIFRKFEKIDRKDIKWFFLSALFTPFLYFLGENFGVKFSTSTIAAIVIATIPLFSPLAGYVAYKEKLSWFNLAGIVISFSGIILMLISKGTLTDASPAGLLCLGGAVISALIYSVMLKKLTKKYLSLNIIAIQNLIGVFLFLPVFLVTELPYMQPVTLNREVITSFLFLSILASSLSFVFYAKTIRILGISKANIFSNLIPVFTAIFSYFILDERFTFQKIAGILIVVAGVYISEITRRNAGFIS